MRLSLTDPALLAQVTPAAAPTSIGFVAAATSATSATTYTVNQPAGTQVGDLVVFVCRHTATGTTMLPGATTIYLDTFDTAITWRVTAGWYIATTAGAQTYTATHVSGTKVCNVATAAFRGANTVGTPAMTYTAANNTSIDAPTVTPDAGWDDAMLFCSWAVTPVGQTITVPGTMTQATNQGTVGLVFKHATAYEDATPGTATGTRTATQSPSGANQRSGISIPIGAT